MTPADLARGGLYKDIAIPLHASERHLAVELSLIARKLGAQRVKRRDGGASTTPLVAAQAHLRVANVEQCSTSPRVMGQAKKKSRRVWRSICSSVSTGMRLKVKAHSASPKALTACTPSVVVAQQSCSAAAPADGAVTRECI